MINRTKEYTFSSKRVRCLKCGSSRGFAPFIEVEGGYCHSCGYYQTPVNGNGKDHHNGIESGELIKSIEPIKYLDYEIINTLPSFEESLFAEYFGNIFGPAFIDHCNKHFLLRADKYRALCYVYKDYDGNLVNIKSIPYLENGHRDKKGFKVLINNEVVSYPAVFGYRKDKKDGYDVIEFFPKGKGYKQCLFNECNLNPDYSVDSPHSSDAPIILVESEKSVIIASYFFPKYIWVASGGRNGLTPEKAKVLQGRRVFLFFDYDDNMNEKDSKTIKTLQGLGIKTATIDLFNGYEVREGYDIADGLTYLVLKGKIKL